MMWWESPVLYAVYFALLVVESYTAWTADDNFLRINGVGLVGVLAGYLLYDITTDHGLGLLLITTSLALVDLKYL